MTDDAFKRALSAIEARDAQEIEYLRDVVTPDLVTRLLETWRASLPWDAKDLYVALLMDQSDNRIEGIMQDALASPSVESRAYAICYLDASSAKFTDLLSSGGWIDPSKVDERVKSYKRRAGIVDRQAACPECGAPLKIDPYGNTAISCEYCGQRAAAALDADPGKFFREGRHWEIRTGVPTSKSDPEFSQFSSVIPLDQAAMKFRALDRPFGPDMALVVQLIRFDGAQETTLTTSTNPVNAQSTTLYKSWTIPRRADYEVRVWNAKTHTLLASTRFRMV
ncbi:MAG: hypothetical protein AB7K71_16015 [Polyangiaceae bacterium]